MGYSEYQALMSDFVNLVQQRLGDQVVSVVLYGSDGERQEQKVRI